MPLPERYFTDEGTLLMESVQFAENTVAQPAKPNRAIHAGAVVRTLSYFDIFHHPLTRDELLKFCPLPAEEVDAALDALHKEGLVHMLDGHYGLHPVGALLDRRRENEKRAEGRMSKAIRMSRFIGSFPFVRGVMLSGSMSKGVLAADGDIDYFVITAPGRLWVARTLLIAYKKLFLLNSRRDFCVNYFVDTQHLVIEDRNLFTATEVVTLKPTFGKATCEAFFEANGWAFEQFPNMRQGAIRTGDPGPRRRKSLGERLLNSRLGEHIDDLCMRLTFLRWKRKFGHLDAKTFELALRTRKYVSKHHPQSFQQRVLGALEERMQRFEHAHDLSWI